MYLLMWDFITPLKCFSIIYLINIYNTLHCRLWILMRYIDVVNGFPCFFKQLMERNLTHLYLYFPITPWPVFKVVFFFHFILLFKSEEKYLCRSLVWWPRRAPKTQFLPGCGRIVTAVWMHYLDGNQTAGEEARRQLHKNVASNIVQVLAATPHKAPTIRPPASHQVNYPS